MLGPLQEVELGELASEDLKWYEPYKQLKCRLYEEYKPLTVAVPDDEVQIDVVDQPTDVEIENDTETDVEQDTELVEETEDDGSECKTDNMSKRELQMLLKQKGIAYRVTESREALLEKLRGEE